MSFNFGKIASIISNFMDSDFIDLKRDIDGVLTPLYTNIPCHIEYMDTDNPDPTTVDIKPIIQSIKIYSQLWVDIRNNDYIIAKKCDNEKNIIAVYSGRCGNPIVHQSRKETLMQMISTDSDVPVPTPAEDTIKISIEYYSDNKEIHPKIEEFVQKNKSYNTFAIKIEGYNPVGYYLDNEYYQNTVVNFVTVGEENHNIKFVYAVSSIPQTFRHLVDGLYTKDDGSLAIGWHLYKKVEIDNIIDNGDDTYTITSDNVSFTHHDNFKVLDISEGVKIVAGDLYLKIDDIVDRSESKVTFVASLFVPTEDQRNAYECDWYG